MCARLTVLSDEPMASAIAGCVNPYSRSNTIFIRSRCFSGTFFHRRSAVFNRRTSDLLHLTICPSRIRWNQRITLRLHIAIAKSLAPNFRKMRFNWFWNRYESLLAVQAVLLQQFKNLEKRVRLIARHDQQARLLMTATGVGPIVSLTYAAAIDDPARFKKSKTVGSHFGITPKKYQSGEIDITGRISKCGDKSVRLALCQAAHIILTKPVKSSLLKDWALRLAKRIGMKKAKVALARKLAVIMHRMLVDGTVFNPAEGAAKA